jgi:hypothetical protein
MNTPPIVVTSKTRTTGAPLAVLGPADTLRAAFEDGSQVTLDGKFAGERVYLGHRRQTYVDDAITLETLGLDHVVGETPRFPGVEIAAYLLDVTRLADAPTLAAAHARTQSRNLAAHLDRMAGIEARAARIADPDNI